MRLQRINMTEFSYRALTGTAEKLTETGRHTGIPEPQYGDGVSYEGNISIPYGYAAQTWFGLDTRYTHVLVMEDPDADIKEGGLIEWKGNTYDITAVRPSINQLAVALKKRTTVGGEQ